MVVNAICDRAAMGKSKLLSSEVRTIEPRDAHARSLAWDRGIVSAQSLGGMLGPTLFLFPDGSQVAPFHVAPWFVEPEARGLGAIMRRMRGEWVCVPFGNESDRPRTGRWPASATGSDEPHGYAANHEWIWDDAGPASLAMHIEYPAGHAVARLERRITPDPHDTAIDFELVVLARRDCALPIGLHPVFRLPTGSPGGALLEINGESRVATFPGDVDESALFVSDTVAPIGAVPTRTGGLVDARALPLAAAAEDLLQLINADGSVGLLNRAEGYRVRVTWDRTHLPGLLLWFSNCGRTAYPWCGRHLALGVEPVCSAFDLGTQISAAPNPLNQHGIPTARRFCAGDVFATRYRIAVEEVGGS
jgi:hypothetical protein